MAILQALTTGQLLDRIFTIYRRNFVLFFSIALIPNLIYMVAMSFSSAGTAQVAATRTGAGLGGVGLGLGFFVLFFVMMLFYAVASAVSQGAATVAISNVYLDRPTSLNDSYSEIMPLKWRLFGLTFKVGLLTGLGFILFIIPGVYFAITYALSFVIMAIEKGTSSEAMERSKYLVTGNRGRIALIFLLSMAISYAFAFGLALPVQLMTVALAKEMPILAGVLQAVAAGLATALAMPIALIGYTLAYYDARVRKEAFDLQYMMDTAPLPEPVATAAGQE